MEVSTQNNKESILYVGGPSQWINYNAFTVCGLIFLCAVFSPYLWDVFFKYFFHQKNAHSIYIYISKALYFRSIGWAFFAWFKVKSHTYTITNERLIETTGMFSRATNEVELFRVRDISLLEPFSLRILGCGNIVLDTTEKSTPILILDSIRTPRPVMEILRKNVEIMRRKRGVREIGI